MPVYILCEDKRYERVHSVDKMTVMNSAPGGFFVFGCLMAGCVWLERKLNKPIERKSCGDVMLEKIDAAKEEQKGGAEE